MRQKQERFSPISIRNKGVISEPNVKTTWKNEREKKKKEKIKKHNSMLPIAIDRIRSRRLLLWWFSR